ncbi:MAG: hypothetical protein HY606_13245 [Planctomycetes bacterium]|nr:hypothetical protein [Planctomycetota bacterium]
MGFFKDLFSGDPWRKVDPGLIFKDRLMDILGAWEFSKLDGLMRRYKVLEHDFFHSRSFTECPDDLKLETFVVFINNWVNFLVGNEQLRDAEIILRTSVKLKNEGNPAHILLTMILAQTDRLKETAEEAKTALKFLDWEEAEIQNIEREDSIPIPNEYQLGDTTKVRQRLYEIIKASEEI